MLLKVPSTEKQIPEEDFDRGKTNNQQQQKINNNKTPPTSFTYGNEDGIQGIKRYKYQ